MENSFEGLLVGMLAVVGSVFFYGAAVLGYVHQGILNKTNNQIRSSIRKEPSSTRRG